MYGAGLGCGCNSALGQPPLDADVLAFDNLDVSLSLWLDYWNDEMQKATTLDAIARVQNAAVDDVYAQGGTDELAEYVRLQVQQMANVRAYNLGLWTPTGAVDVPRGNAVYESPEYSISPVTHVCDPDGVAQMQAMYTDLVQSVPGAEAAVAAGQPGAQETLDVFNRDIVNLYNALVACGAEVPKPGVLPVAGTLEHEVYIFGGIRIEVPANTGPEMAQAWVEDGCVDPRIISCTSTREEPQPTGTEVMTYGPAETRKSLLAGAALLGMLFLVRPRGH